MEAKEELLELRRKRKARKVHVGERGGKGMCTLHRERGEREPSGSCVLKAFKGGNFRGGPRGGSQ